MRRLCAALLIATCVSMSGGAVSLCEYQSAESASVDSRLSFAYRYYDDASTPVVDEDSGRLGASYDAFSDSPNLGLALSATCDVALSGFVPVAWLGHGAATGRVYPWGDGAFFLFGGIESAMAMGLVQPGLDVRAGFGLGRFTDVTPLARAMEIRDVLIALHAVPNGLSDDVLLTVAELIGRAREASTIADVVANVDAVVEFDVGVPLDARALLAIEEVIRRTGGERWCGWAIQVGVGYELLDPYGGAQGVIYAGSGDAAFASGPNDQWLLHASYSGPFAALDENSLAGSASYVLDFARGQSLTAAYTFARAKPAGMSAVATHEVSLGLTFSIARGSLGLQLSVSRESGDPGWSIDVSMSAAMELL